MAINEWKIWRKLGIAKEEEREEVRVEEDLEAVGSFLKGFEAEELKRKVARMGELAREEKIIGTELKEDNLKKQIELLGEILAKYEFLEDDMDLNGIRLRQVGRELLRKAEEKGLKELVKEKKRDIKWRV